MEAAGRATETIVIVEDGWEGRGGMRLICGLSIDSLRSPGALEPQAEPWKSTIQLIST